MKSCPKCHAECPDEDKFCRYCGARFMEAAPIKAEALAPKQPEAPAPSKVPSEPVSSPKPLKANEEAASAAKELEDAADDDVDFPKPPADRVYLMPVDAKNVGMSLRVTFMDLNQMKMEYSADYSQTRDGQILTHFQYHPTQVYLAKVEKGKVRRLYYGYENPKDFFQDRKSPKYGKPIVSRVPFIIAAIIAGIFFTAILILIIWSLRRH